MDMIERVAKAMFEAVEAETQDINFGRLRSISWDERKAEMLGDKRHGDPYTGARAAINAVLETAAQEYDKAAELARSNKMIHTGLRPDGEGYVIYSEQENRCKIVAAEIRHMKL